MSEKSSPDLRPTIAFLSVMTLTYGVAFIGYLGASRGLPFWYESLARPAMSPPSWAFSLIWMVLTFLMGLAAHDVYKEKDVPARTLGLCLFAVQLALHALWCWLFFAFGKLGIALADLAVLFAASVGTAMTFGKVKRLSGGLMIPFVLWSALVLWLNYGFWTLNK